MKPYPRLLNLCLTSYQKTSRPPPPPPPTHTNQVIDVDALDCAPGPVPVHTPMPTDTAVAAPGAIFPEITLEQWNHLGATHSTAPQNRLHVVNQPLSGLVGILSGLVSTPCAPTHSPPSGTVVYTCPISLASLHSNPYQRVREQDISSEPCMVFLEDLAQTQMPHEPDTTTSASDRSSIDVDGDQNQELARGCVAMKACAHQYHEGCLTAALANSMTCAICRAPVSQGMRDTQPSGTMQYKTSKFNHCLGCKSVGIVTITYTFSAGVQRQYHPSPGVKHRGVRRIAYLPDNRDGRMLVIRLLYAFEHGLTFTVGTSYTSRQPNQVTWGSIHHKTSLTGGPIRRGFPNPGYFVGVNEELDSKGVPTICHTYIPVV